MLLVRILLCCIPSRKSELKCCRVLGNSNVRILIGVDIGTPHCVSLSVSYVKLSESEITPCRGVATTESQALSLLAGGLPLL